MRASYFHHVANCLVLGVKPVPYTYFLKLSDKIESGK